MGAVNEVTDADFDEVVLRSDKPVVVDFWADWCGPCKQVAPIIEELATTHGDRVRFVKMDTNTNPVTPANNHVLGLPTIQVYSAAARQGLQGSQVEVGAAGRDRGVPLGHLRQLPAASPDELGPQKRLAVTRSLRLVIRRSRGSRAAVATRRSRDRRHRPGLGLVDKTGVG